MGIEIKTVLHCDAVHLGELISVHCFATDLCDLWEVTYSNGTSLTNL